MKIYLLLVLLGFYWQTSLSADSGGIGNTSGTVDASMTYTFFGLTDATQHFGEEAGKFSRSLCSYWKEYSADAPSFVNADCSNLGYKFKDEYSKPGSIETEKSCRWAANSLNNAVTRAKSIAQENFETAENLAKDECKRQGITFQSTSTHPLQIYLMEGGGVSRLEEIYSAVFKCEKGVGDGPATRSFFRIYAYGKRGNENIRVELHPYYKGDNYAGIYRITAQKSSSYECRD